MSISKKIFMFLFFVMAAMSVNCVSYLAVGRGETGVDGKIDILKVENRKFDKLKKTLELGSSQNPTKLVFSPDGKYLACIIIKKTVSFVSIKEVFLVVYQVGSWKKTKSVPLGEIEVKSIAFDPKSNLFACSFVQAREGNIHVWKTKNWDTIKKHKVSGEDYSKKIGFTKSGVLVGLNSDDAIVSYKKISMKKPSLTQNRYWKAASGKITSIALSPKRNDFIGLLENSEACSIKNFKTASWKFTEKDIKSGMKSIITIELSPSGKYIGYEKKKDVQKYDLQIYDRQFKKLINKPPGSIGSIVSRQYTFDFEDKYFATMTHGAVEVYSIADGKLQYQYPSDHGPKFSAIAFSPEIKLPKEKKGKGFFTSISEGGLFEDLSRDDGQ